jgi:hypothetical protein
VSDGAALPAVTLERPETRDAITRAIARLHEESGHYWASLPTERFLAPIGDAWSPADHVRHLTKSVRAATRGLELPRVLVWLAFGPARAPSRSYDALRETYLGALSRGGQAGKYAPRPLGPIGDAEATRARIMAQHTAAVGGLVATASGWPERALDRCRLPHPLLGKLTVREMLAFTLYHNLHHVQVCASRLRDVAR